MVMAGSSCAVGIQEGVWINPRVGKSLSSLIKSQSHPGVKRLPVELPFAHLGVKAAALSAGLVAPCGPTSDRPLCIAGPGVTTWLGL